LGRPNPAAYRISIEDIGHVAIYWDYEALAKIVRDKILFAAQPVFWRGPIAEKIDTLLERFTDELKARVGLDMYRAQHFWPTATRREFTRSIQRMLLHIARYQHGGAVLITPDPGEDLKPKYSIVYDRLWLALLKQMQGTILWRNAFEGVNAGRPLTAEAYNDERRGERLMREATLEVDGCVHFMSGLSRVDGLIWLDYRLSVHGFGTEIATTADPPFAYSSSDADATTDELTERDPAHFGMRHRSMMRYCYAHPTAVGFVVSQDGPVRAMTRTGDALVYWENAELRDERAI
jgi:hypothetical protein